MHKHQLLQILTDKQQQLAIAFIYLSDELTSSAEIEEKMKILLARISEKLYETPVVIYIVASYLLLQSMHFAHDSSFMSFHSYLFAIRY